MDHKKHWSILLAIEEYIDKEYELAVKWMSQTNSLGRNRQKNLSEWKKIASSTLKAARSSDIIIIDASTDSFSMGYQAAIAKQLKIPLLVLNYDDRWDDSDVTAEHSLLAGDFDGLISFVSYTNIEEACKSIHEFLQKNEITKADMRFNLFLDRQSYRYLKRKASETGATRAKIIRDIIKERADKE